MTNIDWLKQGSLFINGDCVEYMKTMPDKCVSLAICDPPYSINRFKNGETSRLRKYGQLDSANNLRPDEEYIRELFRVSKNQIIWGFNHLCDLLPPTSGFVFWFKHQPVISYSDGELAWTSFKDIARCFDYPYFGCHGADVDRIHPTQKPIALYTWLLQNYAHRGDKILDTHVGSASSLIACHRMGFEYWGFELDADYHKAASERLAKEKSMTPLFEPQEIYKQEGLSFDQ